MMAARMQEFAPSPWLIVRSMRMAGDRMSAWLSGVQSLGFETYYPMIRELRPVPRRKLSHHQRVSNVSIMRPAVVPFLPSTIFVRPAVERPGDLPRHPGVIGFVCVGRDPAQISEVLIERLRARERAGEGGAIPGGTPVEYIFKPGERVRVINGAFTDYTAIVDCPPDVPIERIDADTRLRLTIDIFGRATPVNVAVADVRKV